MFCWQFSFTFLFLKNSFHFKILPQGANNPLKSVLTKTSGFKLFENSVKIQDYLPFCYDRIGEDYTINETFDFFY